MTSIEDGVAATGGFQEDELHGLIAQQVAVLAPLPKEGVPHM